MNAEEGHRSPSGVFIAADFRANLIIDRYDQFACPHETPSEC
jgi:hypothetical protein